MKIDKFYLQVVVGILIVTIGLVLFFKEDILGFKYPFSYPSITYLYEDLETANAEYSSEISSYQNVVKELESLVKRENQLVEMYGATLQNMESLSWKFHLPSLLILLEQNARYFNVRLHIYRESFVEETVERSPSGGKQGEKEGEKGEELEQKTHDSTKNPLLKGNRDIKTEQIPISVIGSYESVRDYLEFLCQVDFLVIDYATVTGLTSGTVQADININVYYTDDGRGVPHG